MKKLLLFITLLLSLSAFSQSAYESYHSTYTSETYNIDITGESMNKYSLYIDSYSLDPSIRTGGILINSSDHLDFISTLKEARIKYSEWTTTSKDNNVTDLSKEMIYSNKAQSYFKYGSKWCFDFSVNLSYSFRVSGDKILLLVKTKEVVSSSNQYMKADGLS